MRHWLGLASVVLCLAACDQRPRASPSASPGLETARLVKDTTCAPDYKPDDPAYPPKLAAKKKALLAAGYPADAVALLDRGAKCVAAIDQAPDAISLKIIGADGSKTTIEWTEDDERIANEGLLSGKNTVYYKLNVARRFACCHEAPYNMQPDWNPDHEVNTGQTLRCVKKAAAVSCS